MYKQTTHIIHWIPAYAGMTVINQGSKHGDTDGWLELSTHDKLVR